VVLLVACVDTVRAALISNVMMRAKVRSLGIFIKRFSS